MFLRTSGKQVQTWVDPERNASPPRASPLSKSALGAKYRRLKARLGAPKAIVAMAHHLARLVYRMLRYGQNYVEQGIHRYEFKFQLQRIKWLKKEARSLNLQLVAA
jgi:transposase